MKFRTIFIILLSAFLALQACKTGEAGQAGTKLRKGWKYTLTNAEQTSLDFRMLTLSGKAIVKMPEQGMRIAGSYRINIAKDSLIWIRVSKFGIEAVRVLITPDSIHVMDKLSNSLRVADFSMAEKFTGLDADFAAVQDLILGNLYLVPEKMAAEKKKGNPHIFTGSRSGMDFRYTIDTDLYKVLEIDAQNTALDQHSVIAYQDFQPEANTHFPKKGSVEVLAPIQTSVNFNHSKIQVNPSQISFKFNVPDHYERISGK